MMTALFFKHPTRIAKAMTTNLLAAMAPGWYSRWIRETGRGLTPMSVDETAAYFIRCVDDYRQRLKLDHEAWREFLRDKRVLEYGPGDIPGVALLLVGLGARQVTCTDRFPLVQINAFNRQVMEQLVDSLAGEARSRAQEACSAFLESHGTHGPIRYRITRDGTSQLRDEVDLLLSRAVLEHVADLDAIFVDMHHALTSNGLAIHQVDLKSHGMHLANPLDFLVWPRWLWRLMYSHKGAPNRVRAHQYRELAEKHGFRIVDFTSTGRADDADWQDIRSRLPHEFSTMRQEDVCCTGFWMILENAND